jgi:hypothetical protein
MTHWSATRTYPRSVNRSRLCSGRRNLEEKSGDLAVVSTS